MHNTIPMPQHIAQQLAALPTPLTPAQKAMITRRKNVAKRMRRNCLRYIAIHLLLPILAYTALYASFELYNVISEPSAPVAAVQWQEQPIVEMIETAHAEELTFASPMHEAIHKASLEFNVPESLLLGIAKAESSMGTDFAHSYDFNCHNYWGIRKVRDDGSYLRCFYDDEAGARTAAKLLANRYIARGLDTPEKICPVWIGPTYAKQNCPHWIENVKSM